ncbi:MAG: M28 family peptidase [Bacteroidota bacterium]
MMRFQFFLFLFLLFTLGGNAQNATTTEKPATKTLYDFSKSNLLHRVKELSSDVYEGRETGTSGATKAKKYVLFNFERLRIKPLGNIHFQPFPMPKETNIEQGVNIIGYIEGTEKANQYIVISAHYDHIGIIDGKIYNGADDDASGVSALFAIGEYLKKNPPKHSVILAAFDAEEKGLVGSQFFVDNPMVEKSQLKLNINMDMISRSKKNELYAVGPQHYKQLQPIIENTEKSGKVNLKIGHKEWTYASDHAGFHRAKIPFVYFGVEDHEDYHKHTDDYENIHPEFYADAVQTILNFFKKVDATNL